MTHVSNTCVASIPNYMRAMENHCPKPYQILNNSCQHWTILVCTVHNVDTNNGYTPVFLLK